MTGGRSEHRNSGLRVCRNRTGGKRCQFLFFGESLTPSPDCTHRPSLADIIPLNWTAQTPPLCGTLGVAQRPRNVEASHVQAPIRPGPPPAVRAAPPLLHRRSRAPHSGHTSCLGELASTTLGPCAARTWGSPNCSPFGAQPLPISANEGQRHGSASRRAPLACPLPRRRPCGRAGNVRHASSPAPNPPGGLAGGP